MNERSSDEQLAEAMRAAKAAAAAMPIGSSSEQVNEAAIRAVLGLRALQSLDREGVRLPLQDLLRPLGDPSQSGHTHAKGWNDAIFHCVDLQRALSPQPETAKEVGETEAVLDGPELWEIVFGVFKGDVPKELTDEKLSQIAAAVQRVFIHPAPQSPPAPVVDEGMWEIEAYDADDNFAFGASGSLEDVRREIAHYAAVYNEPLRFERIQRSTVTFAALEGES